MKPIHLLDDSSRQLCLPQSSMRLLGSVHLKGLSRRQALQAMAGVMVGSTLGFRATTVARARDDSPTPFAGRNVPASGEEVEFSLSDGMTTRGVFDYPSAGAPPYPAVLMLHGAGVFDRDATDTALDGTISRPFAQIAEVLTGAGVAVFRHDKRGVRLPSELVEPAAYAAYTKQLSIDDAAMAFRFMLANPLIDARRTALIAISDGTWFAPYVAARFPDVRAMVLVGTGMGRNAVLNTTQVLLPLLGAARLDADGDGALTDSDLALDSPERMARAVQLMRVQGQIFLLRYEGDGENAHPVGLNRKLDRNGDGKLDLLTEVRPVYEAFRAQYARPVAVAKEYADAGVLPLAVPLLERNEALEGALNTSFEDEPADQNLRALLALTSRPRLLIVSGEHDDQTPASSAEQLAGALARAGYPATLRIEQGLSHALSLQADVFAPYNARMEPRPLQEIAAWLRQSLA